MKTRRFLGLAGGLTAASVAGARLALQRADAKWIAEPDLVPPGERLLPAGVDSSVETDDGARLAVTTFGPSEGPLVVLVHGFTNGREVWAPVVHRLVRAGHLVVAYDQRGHGSSTVGTDPYSVRRLGLDLEQILTAVDAREAVLVGHSMGGMTIQAFAGERPEVAAARSRALVLVSTAASGIGRDAASDRTSSKVVGGRGLERLLHTSKGHAFFRTIFGHKVRRADLDLAKELFLATRAPARAGLTVAMQAIDLRTSNASISLPTTVIVGARDSLLPPRLAEEVASSIPGARLVRLEAFGHMLPLEAPREVAEAILAAAAPIGQTERSLA